MVDELIFELPTLERENEAKEFIQEFRDAKSEINGTGRLDSAEDYSAWVKEKINEHEGINLPQDRVPVTTYFVVRKEDNRIIGMANLRHRLSDYLKESYGGHIGGCIRPSERKKGYGTVVLKMGLAELAKRGINSVLIGCYPDNEASKKVILKCGGVPIGESKKDGKTTLGFEIKIGENKK